ncbi:MAG: flagellar basal body P-ring protein FlgI [Planctomycetota bacterium]|nr:flagellar basal body P-ring protein FlgI [Planctomycetota bacterium]
MNAKRRAPLMHLGRRSWMGAVVILSLLAAAPPVSAVRIKDITHLKGRRENRLIGYGLVVGLSGTGDGSKYETTILTLQSLLSKLSMPVPAVMLKDSKNVAVVLVDAILPENGVREGDSIDVQVSSIGAAKSLLGGRLVMTPLQGPGLDRVFAWAGGSIRLPDSKNKGAGVIRNGAVMEADVIHNYISREGRITLVLEDHFASWSWAAAIAERVNEDASEIGRIRRLAKAEGPKSVVVQIPESSRLDPAGFIASIEQIELLLPPTEARVVINRRTGTIVISEDVEIGPAVISHNGMSITTVRPPRKPTVENPVVEERYAAPINASSTDTGGTKLQELVDALNSLHVPASDIIEIIENLSRGGKLTGKLEFSE